MLKNFLFLLLVLYTNNNHYPHWNKVPWQNLEPRRNVSEYPHPLLNDIERHMPRSHIYRSQAQTTWMHETTHGLNSRLRNQSSLGGTGKVNAFYCLHDKYVVFEEPNITFDHVDEFIPDWAKQESLYRTYIQNPRSRKEWGHIPLYLFDEWIAYTNGAELQIQGDEYSATHMMVFSFYAGAVLNAIEKYDPQYSQYDKLRNFYFWNVGRGFQFLSTRRHKTLKEKWLNTYTISRK